MRAAIWLVGLIASAALFYAVRRNEVTEPLVILIVVLTIAFFALIAEFAALGSNLRESSRRLVPVGAKPPDGVVEISQVLGVEGVSCSSKPEFRRFTDLSEVDLPVFDVASSNSPLLGRVVIISVFVGRDGIPWSDLEIARGLEALKRAGVWIEREAIRFAAPVNLALADVYFQVDDDLVDPVEITFQPEGDDVGPIEANATTKAVVMASRAAASLGFADVADWMEQINRRVVADARVWLFHVRRAGRSIAIDPQLSGLPNVGFAVCYAREASFPEPLAGRARIDPATIAHELLHLFGATDKYGVALGSFPRGSVSSREIMRLNHDSLYRMTIDRLTAFEVGWSIPSRKNPPVAILRGDRREIEEKGPGLSDRGKNPLRFSSPQSVARSWRAYWPGSPRRRRGGNRHIWRAGQSVSRLHRRRLPCGVHAIRWSRLAGTTQT